MKKNFVLIALCLAVVFFLYTAAELIIPLPFGNKSIEFEIKQGTSFRQVVEALAQRGMVRDKWVFLVLGRLTGIDRKIKAGYYPLWGTMSPLQIFNAMRLGSIIEYEITVVPGDSLREIGDKFFALGVTGVTEFQKLSADRAYLDELDIDAPSLEGYLYPDTYRFPKGLDITEVLTIMVNRLRDKFTDEMLARTMELGLSERDVLTMASIVEKEAITDEERPIIAAVYYNRLKRSMPLQADPTAIYGIKGSNERITRDDLLKRTPYNTYMIKGLPPGPIASPGLKSIQAALNPADVPFLYFVSNNDGTHNFSVTLSNHEEAVKAYRGKKKTASSKSAS
jgi:UPF0755 protein